MKWFIKNERWGFGFVFFFFIGNIFNNNLEEALKQIQAFLTLSNGYILKSYILDKVF